MTGTPNLVLRGHFNWVEVFIVSAICLVDTVYSEQRFNIGVGDIEIGLDCGFVKQRLNFV